MNCKLNLQLPDPRHAFVGYSGQRSGELLYDPASGGICLFFANLRISIRQRMSTAEGIADPASLADLMPEQKPDVPRNAAS